MDTAAHDGALSTRQIAESMNARGMPENSEAGKKGGGIAKKARMELEEKTGKSVITSQNYLPPAKKGKNTGLPTPSKKIKK